MTRPAPFFAALLLLATPAGAQVPTAPPALPNTPLADPPPLATPAPPPAAPATPPAGARLSPQLAPPTQPPPPVVASPPLPRVALVTSAGTITITLEKTKAPATVANFLKYVDLKRFDGTSFYRALSFPAPTPLGLIQGGLRGRSDKVLPPVRHEPTSATGLTHDDGAISMARAAPGTANADFFIILGKLDALDAKEGDPGYAVFGHVTEGMDVVRAIQTAPVSPTAGEGAMKGQMLLKPVTLISARRVSAAAAAPAPTAAQSRR